MTLTTLQFHRGLQAAISMRAASVVRDLGSDELLAEALSKGEGHATQSGAFAVNTAPFTGRSPKDKFIVRDAMTRDRVWWDNTSTMAPDTFEQLLADMMTHVEGRELHAQSLIAAPDADDAFGIEVVTETAWHAHFIRTLLRPATGETSPSATVLHLPSFEAEPARHGTRSSVVIALDLSRRLVLIGGTAYAGEIKKAVFSLFNFHAPLEGVLPMHCAANVGRGGDTALFFGLSGTGKTTLSTSEHRLLLGDDEHGWASDGTVFNLENGCYAKTAKLSIDAEPAIHAAALARGTVLENVTVDDAGVPDFDDLSITENGRAAYPLTALPNATERGVAGTPTNVLFLSADAFGVLPPIARLSPGEALLYFLCGYSSKLAGTERGVVEPQATFSPCFGAPFMALLPTVYAQLLEDRLNATRASCWLVNTGWTGGAYGTGRRMPIAVTRRLVDAVLGGELANVPMRRDPVFGFEVPLAVEGVDPRLLTPRAAWADPLAFDAEASRLLGMFNDHLKKHGAGALSEYDKVTSIAAE